MTTTPRTARPAQYGKGAFLSAGRSRCITDEVLYERSRQKDEWGEQDWSEELRAELIQVAATVVGWIEAIDRRNR